MILSEIRQEARSRLEGKWGSLVPIWLIYLLIMMVPGILFKQSLVQFIINLVLGGPFAYSICKIGLRIVSNEQVEVGHLFEGFSDFARTFTANLMMTIYILLWMLLLIVPGIIAGLGYSMTFIIMAEDPAISAGDAMRKSKEMMMGHKTDMFLLGLSFFGWIILGILTLGIGLLWVESYIATSLIIFYQQIKGSEQEKEMRHSNETIIHREEPVMSPTEPKDETLN